MWASDVLGGLLGNPVSTGGDPLAPFTTYVIDITIVSWCLRNATGAGAARYPFRWLAPSARARGIHARDTGRGVGW